MAILENRVPYSQRYLFNAIPDTNHNANPTNPNRNSKGIALTLRTLLILLLGTVVNMAPAFQGLPRLLALGLLSFDTVIETVVLLEY